MLWVFYYHGLIDLRLDSRPYGSNAPRP